MWGAKGTALVLPRPLPSRPNTHKIQIPTSPLSGTTSPARRAPPFAAGERGQIAVDAIDTRGKELLVVKKLE